MHSCTCTLLCLTSHFLVLNFAKLPLDIALWHTVYPLLPCKWFLQTTQASELASLNDPLVIQKPHTGPLASINGASTTLTHSSTMLQVLSQQCSLPSGLTHHYSTNLQATLPSLPKDFPKLSSLMHQSTCLLGADRFPSPIPW